MYKVKLNESDLQTISRFGKLAMIGKYSHRRQWVSRTAYKTCLREIRQAKGGKDVRSNLYITSN